MQVVTYPYGPLGSNMYYAETSAGKILIDPSVYPKRLSKKEMPSKIDYILITHGHFDHIDAIDKWNKLFPFARIYISYDDLHCFKDPLYNCSIDFADPVTYDVHAFDIKDLNLPGLTVIRTPGHSKGGLCFLFEEGEDKVLFSGDTLFAGSVGRTDLTGGNTQEMIESLKKLRELDPSTQVYPGHGAKTSLESEFRYNPFFNF